MSLPGVDEARRRMLARLEPLLAEAVACDEADGRVLRQDVRATRDQPPFDASAMDGWAVRKADAETGRAELLIVGESASGRGWDGHLDAGQAVRISTGAPLPDGADWIVIQEEAERSGDRVRVGPLGESGSFVRPRGGDFGSGDLLLAAGVQLNPWRIALAAAAGFTELQASKRPGVAIVSTGDEIVAPGAVPGPWQIHDSAGAGLTAWFQALGCETQRLAPLPDDRDAVTAALRRIACDLMVIIGGASVGDHDVVKPALAALGLDMIVKGVAVRPGKPTWFGLLSDGRRVLGLPGNPVSAMVCAELFGRGLVSALQGVPGVGPRMRRARLLSSLEPNGPREHYMRAALRAGADGGLEASVESDQDSSLVTVLASAACLVRRAPYAPAAKAGDVVDVVLLERA
jgi:molybdopterin molybdotransferase